MGGRIGGREEILCQIGEREGGSFLKEKTWVIEGRYRDVAGLKATLWRANFLAFAILTSFAAIGIPSLRSGRRASNPLRRFLRPQAAADVGRGLFLLNCREHRFIDPLGFFGEA